ncbi:MAG: ATP-binding protein [Candidatus Limnocylindrales bacterium]
MSLSKRPDSHRPAFGRGLAWRIALVGIGSALVAVGIITVGVWVIGKEALAQILMEYGDNAAHAYGMFDQSIRDVLVVATIIGIMAGVVLAVLLSRMLARPLADIGAAARRVAGGDLSIRVPRAAPDELASLADSFNQMAAELEESERQRRDIIANTAHELRTPLTNLEGYLEAIRDGVIEADASTYESLLEETERLVRLARSLDDLAIGDAANKTAQPVEVDLATLMRAAAELTRPTFDARSLRLERHWTEPLPAMADPDQFAQVLANLLQNAARYASEGGVVVLAAEQRGDTVLVSVTNSGESIPAEDLPRLFERFYRVEKSRDRARGGVGIGLAIVKQIVEGWGGRVGAESSSGLTRFWFSLPQGGSTAPGDPR